MNWFGFSLVGLMASSIIFYWMGDKEKAFYNLAFAAVSTMVDRHIKKGMK